MTTTLQMAAGHPLTTKRLVIGHVAVCRGCCCGNTGRGKPAVPVEWLKKEWRERGLLKVIQLTISGCLGPCDLFNVVTVSTSSGTRWLGSIRHLEQYRALVDWAFQSKAVGTVLALPDMFTECQFDPFRTALVGHGRSAWKAGDVASDQGDAGSL
jgi:cobaltochelatase CobN